MTIKEIIEYKNNILTNYLSKSLKRTIKIKEIAYLGKGVHGEAYKAISTDNESFILKEFMDSGRNLDFPEDRIREALLSKRTFNQTPGHVKVYDIVQQTNNHIQKLSTKNPIIIMEEAMYDDYFKDLENVSKSQKLSENDKVRIKILAESIAEIHSKKAPESYYRRYIKDWFGYGIIELTNELKEMLTDTEIKKLKYKFIDREHELSKKSYRSRRIHGELFPGTIKFSPENKFITFDMRRFGAGEPADDLGSVLYNYFFHSFLTHNKILPCFKEAANLLLNEYLKITNDNEIKTILPTFMAYRSMICIHPEILPIPKKIKLELKKLLYELLDQKELNIDKLSKLY